MESGKLTQKEMEIELVEIYIKVKKSYIFAEETNPEFKNFLQPPFEINKAYDHFNRSLAARHGLVTVAEGHSPEKYITDNFDKAKGHLYRAYFDILDWISMNLRESIAASFEPYSKDAIMAVTPEYFSHIAPLVQELSEKIAAIRNNKDVVNSGTLKLLEEYEKAVETLKALRTDINKKLVGLIEYERKKREEQFEIERSHIDEQIENEKKKQEAEKRQGRRDLMIGLWSALAGGLITWAIAASYP